MRVASIRQGVVPIASDIANAYIDFSKMTLSLVAVITDVVRDGEQVVGYGFNSNGRYGQGALMRERFIPRLLEADASSLLDENTKYPTQADQQAAKAEVSLAERQLAQEKADAAIVADMEKAGWKVTSLVSEHPSVKQTAPLIPVRNVDQD